MKKVFAIICAVLVMACAVVPCFAWGDMGSPDNYGLPVTGAPIYANYEPNTTKVIEVVQKAMALDKFGGMPVLQIMYYFSGDSFVVAVMCPASTTGGFITANARENPKDGTIQAGTVSGTNREVAFIPSPQTYVPFVTYVLQHGGDWVCSGYYTASQYISLSNASVTSGQTMWKRVAYWSATYHEFRLANASSQYTAGQGVYTGQEMSGLNTIIEVYDEALEKMNYTPEPATPSVSYQLDIPAIFNGMFNGVRSILSGFDLNVFGISIVGMLVAFIVIAIVAFIVRKLWK